MTVIGESLGLNNFCSVSAGLGLDILQISWSQKDSLSIKYMDSIDQAPKYLETSMTQKLISGKKEA